MKLPSFRSRPSPGTAPSEPAGADLVEQLNDRIRNLVQLCEDRRHYIDALETEIAELRQVRMRLLDEASVLRSAAMPYRGPPVPVVLGVDIEPDARVVDLRNPSWDATTAFFAKVVPSGFNLEYAGFIGGASSDSGEGIVVDASRAAYVTGWSGSGVGFPATVGPYTNHFGDVDAFVAKIAPNGRSFPYAGFIGGSGRDQGFDVAVDASGSAYVTGATDSTFAFPAFVGPSTKIAGAVDVPPAHARSAYARAGDVFAWACVAIVCGSLLVIGGRVGLRRSGS